VNQGQVLIFEFGRLLPGFLLKIGRKALSVRCEVLGVIGRYY